MGAGAWRWLIGTCATCAYRGIGLLRFAGTEAIFSRRHRQTRDANARLSLWLTQYPRVQVSVRVRMVSRCAAIALLLSVHHDGELGAGHRLLITSFCGRAHAQLLRPREEPLSVPWPTPNKAKKPGLQAWPGQKFASF